MSISSYTAAKASSGGTHSTTKLPAAQAQYSKTEESAFEGLRNIVHQLTNRQPATPYETLLEAARLMKALPAENAKMRQQLSNMGGAPGGLTAKSGRSATGTHYTKPKFSDAERGAYSQRLSGQAQHGPGFSKAMTAAHQPNKAGASPYY
ncbi:hypothetical protein F5J12DRAFT_498159 [Pisolithus orientalis]|uniref:uncharacterized protein n=1 Tax=Pisolithus orientalis TaxID=936130 RepID=UPI002224625A|nr:uncharacterized protein F5J12DRAFT_498159 [Pisolithus orientalis]KAI6020021.1 hypothetical protein F5J12DRAFT_498159 [Pisolithus orientalis]